MVPVFEAHSEPDYAASSACRRTTSWKRSADHREADMRFWCHRKAFIMISMLPEETAPLVLIVDDDEAVRTAIGELMLSVGIEAACYGPTRELIESPLRSPSCFLIMPVLIPGPRRLVLLQHEQA